MESLVGNFYLNSLLFFFCIELTFLYSWWSNSDITVYADPKDIEHLKNEYAINLTNHRYEIDWLVGLVTAQKLGLLGVKFHSIPGDSMRQSDPLCWNPIGS
jgi:hypothetical protein